MKTSLELVNRQTWKFQRLCGGQNMGHNFL